MKSPGPDGFQVIFFKQYWHVVGDDIWQVVKEAFSTGYFDLLIAETRIALIPMVIQVVLWISGLLAYVILYIRS